MYNQRDRIKLTNDSQNLVASILGLANNNGLAVAIVDSSGNQVSSFGGGTQYAEGTTASTITGTAAMWEDTGNTIRAISATYPLPVNIVAGAGSGGTAQADNSTFTAGTTSLTPIGGVFNDSMTDPTSGQTSAVRITQERGLHINLRNASGTEIGTLAAPVSVQPGTSVTFAATQSGTWNVGLNAGTNNIGDVDVLTLPTVTVGTLPSIPAGTNNIGDVDVLTLPTVTVGTLPSIPAGTNNIGDVDVLTLPTVTVGTLPSIPAGTNNIGDVDVLTLPTVTVGTLPSIPAGSNNIGTVNSVGNVAHDAADSGNPIKIGGVARNTNPTAVADGDRAQLMTDLAGRQIVRMHGSRNLTTQNTITLSTTTETTLLTAGGAGVFLDATCFIITNSSASAVRVDIRDATAGTIRIPVQLAAGAGAVITLPVPVTQTTANSNWTAQLSSAVTDVRIFAQAVQVTA